MNVTISSCITRIQSTSPVAFYLHDAMYLYMLALNKTVANGQDRRNGSLLVRNSIGQNFIGRFSLLRPIHTARHDSTRRSSWVVSGGVDWLLDKRQRIQYCYLNFGPNSFVGSHHFCHFWIFAFFILSRVKFWLYFYVVLVYIWPYVEVFSPQGDLLHLNTTSLYTAYSAG